MTRSDDWAASKKKVDLDFILDQWKRDTPWGVFKRELEEINSTPHRAYWWRKNERRRASERYIKRLEHRDFVEEKNGV